MPGALGLLTDFGLRDGYVGMMKAVALGIAPDARIVDISHDIAPQDIEMGSWTLGIAWRYFPAGSVLVCVVDPGVGGERRAITLAAGGRYFVGPDNGLFTHVLAQAPAERCVELTNTAYHLPGASATFHGRDIFAPCGAHLLAGVTLDTLGAPVDPETLARLPIPLAPSWEGETLVGRVAHVDHFGNLISDIPLAEPSTLSASGVRIEVGGCVIARYATHFAAGPVDELFALRDSSRALAIAVRDGSAAAALGVGRGAVVRVRGLPYP
ncbi:MAG TPA: SAM-dependent chlorinase/fluorinase [Ktedonobacterales bacterium]|nr:SAM-dependent chlorinase/fluorinase [Ktedonobacterales bacterium]